MATVFRAAFLGGGTSGTVNRAITLTPAVGDLLVVFVSLSGNASRLTCSDNQSGTYYAAEGAVWGGGVNVAYSFVREQRVASAVSHVVTVASGPNTAGEIVVVACQGGDRAGAAAVRSSGVQVDQPASTIPNPIFDQTVLSSNLTIGAVASGDTTTTPPVGWTERADASQATPTTALAVATRDSGFAGTRITFGAAQSTTYAAFALEIDGSPAPSPVDWQAVNWQEEEPLPEQSDARLAAVKNDPNCVAWSRTVYATGRVVIRAANKQ